jgi:hypothetical protein
MLCEVMTSTQMQADWTRPNQAISRYLESFNRFGIPFNAVYGPGAPNGIVFVGNSLGGSRSPGFGGCPSRNADCRSTELS